MSQISQLIWKEFGVLLRLFRLMNLILNLYHPIDIQEREACLGYFVEWKTSSLACILTYANQFFQTWQDDATVLHILIPCLDPYSSSQFVWES